MAACASPGDEQRTVASISLSLCALFLAVSSGNAGLCPARCHCDDDSLRSSCAYGGLDVVPIQLNPEIRHLDLSGNRIVSLHMAFDFYSGLEDLDLSSNLIHTLGSNNFRLQQRLLSLNLSSNVIRALAKTTLHGLAELRTLDLSSNNITEVDEQAFHYTSELEWLDLGTNGITSLPAGLLRNLHRIRNLVLRGNSLLEVPASNLALAPSLEQLDLANNLVQELAKDSLPSLPALTQLELANNVLRRISDEAFDRTPGLQGLDLSSNNLTSVPSRALSRLPMLGALVLSRNPLGELRDLAFRNLFELRTLEINECVIARIASHAFADNINLERISMEGNRDLTELPIRLLYAAGNLRWISLRRCNLASLQPTQFPVDGLASLRLGGNPLVCNCSVHWLWNVLRAEEWRNGTRLELDSQEIVCADEEFAGKALMSLSESSLRCRLNPLYLSLSAIGCLAATAAILGFVAHLTRTKWRKRVLAYATPTRPELFVYVGRTDDEVASNHQESYSRKLIGRTEDLVYEAAHQVFQQSQCKSGSESPVSRETNVYETTCYSQPNRRDDTQSLDLFYHQQRAPSSPALSLSQLGYQQTSESRLVQRQESVYAVADVVSLRHEQRTPEVVSLYRMRNPGHHPLSEESINRDYDFEYDYDYDAPIPPQKPYVVFV